MVYHCEFAQQLKEIVDISRSIAMVTYLFEWRELWGLKLEGDGTIILYVHLHQGTKLTTCREGGSHVWLSLWCITSAASIATDVCVQLVLQVRPAFASRAGL